MTKWSQLPVAGGLYDQHPQLIDEWEFIGYKKNEARKRESKRAEAKAKAKHTRR